MSNPKVKALEAKRKSLYSIVQNVLELSRELNIPENKRAFEIRMQTLDQIRRDYLQVLDDLTEAKLDSNPDYTPSYKNLETFEEIYCQIKYAESSSKRDIKQESTEKEIRTVGRLPALQLVSFSGDVNLWPIFHQNFKDLVHNNEQLTKAEKVQYLVSKLSGRALSVVAGILPTAINYDIMWKALTDRYENARFLATFHLDKILNFKRIITPDEKSLNNFTETIDSAFAALKMLNITDLANFIISHISLSKLDKTTIKEFEQFNRSDKIPCFESISEFVKTQARIALRTGTSVSIPSNKPSTQCHVITRQADCVICNAPHTLYSCRKFKLLNVPQRLDFIKRKQLCLNCLSRHNTSKCPSKRNCKICKRRHNSLLCTETREQASGNIASDSVKPVALNARVNISQYSPTIRVDLNTGSDSCSARALLDTGANGNFISLDYCVEHNLKIKYAKSEVLGLASHNVSTLGYVNLDVTSRIDNKFHYKIEATVLQNITEQLPTLGMQQIFSDEFKHLPLADEEFAVPGNIDCILGADMFARILKGDRVAGKKSNLIAIDTTFGYIIMGSIEGSRIYSQVAVESPENDHILNRSLQNLWELEAVPQRKHWSPEEVACEEHFLANLKRDSDGIYSVALPFREDPGELGDSYRLARRRFLTLENKLESDAKLREGYNATVREYIAKGFLSKLEVYPGTNPAYYIPHRAVYKPEKDTSKIRIVLDASCKTTSGKSLNDILYKGPNLQSSIFNLLNNFRLFEIAISADIEKMFFSIRVAPEHRRFLRVLYRFHRGEPVGIYEFERVPFGLSSSPYLARRIVSRLFCDEDSPWLKSALASSTFSYMDDYLISVQSLDEAAGLRSRLVDTFASAGFNLTKWISNSSKFMEDIPEGTRAQTGLSLDGGSETKLVGLWWDPVKDHLFFKAADIDAPARCSKRHILSVTAALYDPLGFLAPLTAGMKLLIQECWKRELGWDQTVPPDIESAWYKIRSEMSFVSHIKIPRHLGVSKDSDLALLGFADASEKCYGAVIYARVGSIVSPASAVSLVCAKSRVAPLKKISLARLELCAAHLLSLLLKSVIDEITERRKINTVFAFSDSEVALAWIRSPPHKWHTFIANRTAAIQEIVPPESWYHIAGKLNPSDVISRPVSPRELIARRDWFEGPTWTSSPHLEWPCAPCKVISVTGDVPELKPIVLIQTQKPDLHPLNRLGERISNWNRLLNIVVYVLRFSRRLHSTGPITVLDQESAEVYIIKHIQSLYFSEEMQRLIKNKSCSKAIRKLNPFIEKGILRVGGRLMNAPFAFEQKHPVLLPGKNHFTRLLVEHYHKLNCHAGPSLLLALLRQRFWIMSARDVVRRTVHACNTCFRTKPVSVNPLMGSLPECRMQGIKAFDRTGVDYAGPIYITLGKGRKIGKHKAYICLFICLATKAVHIELVSDLSSDLFLAAFKRFLARRGPVSLILSDGGTNFIGARHKLAEIYELLSSREFNSEILAELTPRKVEFKTIPPASPNQGGLWESNIKNIKSHLFRVMGTQVLTYEELSTLLAQIEAILNSRPLCSLSSDPSDPAALTPAHFLTLKPLEFLPAKNLDGIDVNRVQRYALVDKLVQAYWKRWHLEYLTSLQRRDKWNTVTQPVEEGQLVILKEPNTPPLCWPLGIISETFPGTDNITRVVKIKTKTGSYIRPVCKVCPLPSQ